MGKRIVLVSFAVELEAEDDRTPAEIAEAILAEYGKNGGDATLYVVPA